MRHGNLNTETCPAPQFFTVGDKNSPGAHNTSLFKAQNQPPPLRNCGGETVARGGDILTTPQKEGSSRRTSAAPVVTHSPANRLTQESAGA